MSLQYSPTLINITNSFQKQGLATNSYYSRDQIYAALDRMCGRKFDEAVAEQLFEQCQLNYKQQVLLEDFCQTVIEADKILKRKIAQTEEQIVQYTHERDECSKQYNDSKYNQQVNLQGVEKDSLLSILLHNAQGIRPREDFSMSFVALTVGKYQHTSNGSQGGDKTNPIYNQQFQFIIETGQEDVDFKLYVLNRNNQQIMVGQGQIELGELHDQNVHELTLPLDDQYGQTIATKLQIEVQWMYNKVKYYNELMTRYNESVEQLNVDLDDFKRDLFTIQEPFTQLRQSAKPQDRQFGSVPQTTPHPQTSNFLTQDYQQPTPQLPQRRTEPATRAGQPSEEMHIGFLLILLLGWLALFESFARPAYVDILLFLLLVIIIVADHFEPDYIKTVGGITIVSMVSDIIWLSFYKDSWKGTDINDPIWSGSGEPILRLVIIFSFLSLILKAILCYFIYHFYLKSQTQEVYYFDFNHIQFEVGRQRKNLFTR